MNHEETLTSELHRYNFREQEVEVTLENFREQRGDVMAELTVRTARQPKPGLLHHGRLNLVSTSARQTVVKALDRYDTDFDFADMLELVCYRSLARWREGDPTIDLRETSTDARPRWVLEPFVEASGASILFGDGGSAKSMFATFLAASVSRGVALVGDLRAEPVPVLYLDWEADQHVHAERLRAVSTGAGIEVPPVYYRRQVASLPESAQQIRKEIARLGVGLVIVDSLGAARGGDADMEGTIKAFAAARSFGVPWLGIDHVAKNAATQSRPYGSTYTHNLARLTWGMERVQGDSADDAVIALTNHKANNGRLQQRQAFRLRFENRADRLESVTIDRLDPTDVPELAERLPAAQRIMNELRSGKQNPAELADTLGLSVATVRARLNDLLKRGSVVRLEDGWGIPA